MSIIQDRANPKKQEIAKQKQVKEKKDKELREKQNNTAKKQAIFNKTLAIADIAVKLGQTIVAANLAAKTIDAVSLGVGGKIYQAIEIPLSIALAIAVFTLG